MVGGGAESKVHMNPKDFDAIVPISQVEGGTVTSVLKHTVRGIQPVVALGSTFTLPNDEC